jgi:hypothetical protein
MNRKEKIVATLVLWLIWYLVPSAEIELRALRTRVWENGND